MITEPMHFSLSLDLVSWRANLWTKQQRGRNEQPSSTDKTFMPRDPLDDEATDDEHGDSYTEEARFVRQPVRVVYTPRRRQHE
jgi:hypothetical protein